MLSFAGGQFAQVAISAFIVTAGVRARPLPDRDQASRPSLWAVSADGIRIVFGSRTLLTLLLFGWLAGFYIVPEGLAAPYAHLLDSTLTVGLLMAAMPAGMVAGAFLLGRMATPSTRMRMMGWLAMLAVNWTQLHASAAHAQQPEAPSS